MCGCTTAVATATQMTYCCLFIVWFRTRRRELSDRTTVATWRFRTRHRLSQIKQIMQGGACRAKVCCWTPRSGADIGQDCVYVAQFIERVFEQAAGLALSSCRRDSSYEWRERERAFTHFLLEALQRRCRTTPGFRDRSGRRSPR